MKQVLSQDAIDLLVELNEAGAEYLVVGGHALAVHGVSRATVDLDVLVRPISANAARVLVALRAFGAPVAAHGLSAHDLAREGTVYQMGLPPNRIDVITSIDGVDFETAWRGRVQTIVDGVVVPFLGREELIANKLAAARPKDLADVAALEDETSRRR